MTHTTTAQPTIANISHSSPLRVRWLATPEGLRMHWEPTQSPASQRDAHAALLFYSAANR